jgi:tetratricopeptide (TPR) repeat protein
MLNLGIYPVMNIKHNLTGLFLGFFIFSLIVAGCSTSAAQIKKEKESEGSYKLGLAYLNDTPPNLQKAYIEFLKAVENNPKNRDAHYAVGHIYAQRQEYLKAISEFQKVLAIDPTYAAAHNYLGKAYELLGNDTEAISAYQSALANLQYETPQYPHWSIAMIYLKQKQYQKGVDSLLQVRKLEPANPVVLYKIGETYREMGDLDNALLFFKESVSVIPNDHLAHYQLASFYLSQGSVSLASDAFKKVIDLAPQSAEAAEAKKSLESLGVPLK